MKRYNRLKLFLIVCFVVLFTLSNFVYANKREHTAFFEGTDYELHVYKISGKEPGETLLLIGGIQGDEPGGFLSADLYTDFYLAKGNLIVVPRANFQSIVLGQRQVNEDMNRKFADDKKDNYETRVVKILKELISESDCMLNLHDGSGYYSDTWESPNRNPKRYGQSIIADCETYISNDKSKVIKLGEMAKKVSLTINKKIKNKKHHFHFNNHKTQERSSKHKEQRKSATYYALYSREIPAFGIETCKALPLELKVRHHNLAINAFMEMFGVIPETPSAYLDPPVLRYLVISINNSLPMVVGNQRTLNLNYGDTIKISHIEANYERGLNVNIKGFGTINDIRKPIQITKPTRVIVRKDYYPCGSIYLALSGGGTDTFAQVLSRQTGSKIGPDFLYYKILINGKEQICRNYEHVKLIRGDTIEIEDVTTGICDPSSLEVNFKGYVGDKVNNTGEDRGYTINTGKDLWKRYSLDRKGKRYQVVALHKNATIGKLFIDLEDPVIKYLVFSNGDGQRHCYTPGETISINTKKKMQLIDIITNVYNNNDIKAFLAYNGSVRKTVTFQDAIGINSLPTSAGGIDSRGLSIDVQRGNIAMGSVFLQIDSSDAS